MDKVTAVEVKRVFLAPKHVLPNMIENSRGGIVRFSSIDGLVGDDEFTAYHVATGVVTLQTRQDAAIYGKHGIRVNSVRLPAASHFPVHDPARGTTPAEVVPADESEITGVAR